MPMERFNVILGMDWLSRYWAVINCARLRVTPLVWISCPDTKRWLIVHADELLLLNVNEVANQANRHAIWPTSILRSFIKGRWQIETYGSLLAKESEMKIGARYPRLHMVEGFPDDLLELPSDKEIYG